MKFRMLLLLLAICTLCACSPNSDNPDPTAPTASAMGHYELALSPICNGENLVLSATWELQRQVGEETFSESITTNASYAAPGSKDMEAFIAQTIKIGSGETDYAEFYTDGRAYCQNGVDVYACKMSPEAFMGRQIPAVLLDPALYASISEESTENRTLIRFSEATALEDWAASEDAVLLSASGTATLDPEGTLLQSAYLAEYRLGETTYTLKVTSKVSSPAELDLSDKFPAGLKNYPTLAVFDAPLLLSKAIGNIRTANAITCSNQEQLNCAAAGVSRTQQVLVNTYGSGDDFIARTEYSGKIISQTAGTTSTEQTELFLDGKKTVSIDQSEPIDQPGYTAQQMRSYCESSVLSALFPFAYLKDAQLSEDENTYTLQFTGTEALANALCASIYDSLQTGNLDSFAESYDTDTISGYLTLDRFTGLPVKAGLSISRMHVIGGLYYKLTYKLDSDIALASETAYDTIMGKK